MTVLPIYAWIKILVVTTGTTVVTENVSEGELFILYDNVVSCEQQAEFKETELARLHRRSLVGDGLKYDVVCKMVRLAEPY